MTGHVGRGAGASEFRAELAQRFARFDKQYLAPQPARATAGTGGRPSRRANAARMGGDAASARCAPAISRGAPRRSTRRAVAAAAVARRPGRHAVPGRRDRARAPRRRRAVAAFEGLLDVRTPAHDGYDVRVRLAWRRCAASASPPRRPTCGARWSFDPMRVEPHALLAELYKDQQRSGRSAGRAGGRAAPGAAERRRREAGRPRRRARPGDRRASRSSAPIAIFIDPADPDLHAALGRALAATGKTAAGAAALERALIFGAKQPALLHLELAALYDRLGDRRQGRRAPRRRRRRRPPTRSPPGTSA